MSLVQNFRVTLILYNYNLHYISYLDKIMSQFNWSFKTDYLSLYLEISTLFFAQICSKIAVEERSLCKTFRGKNVRQLAVVQAVANIISREISTCVLVPPPSKKGK